MKNVEKRATTGYLKAKIEGDAEQWEAGTVVYQGSSPSFIVGGPEGGAQFKGLFFSFPADISTGKHAINRSTRVSAWFNPGMANSWTADEQGGTVTVASVSTDEPSIEISFEFVAVNPQNVQERKKIAGTGEFKGRSLKSDVTYKTE